MSSVAPATQVAPDINCVGSIPGHPLKAKIGCLRIVLLGGHLMPRKSNGKVDTADKLSQQLYVAAPTDEPIGDYPTPRDVRSRLSDLPVKDGERYAIYNDQGSWVGSHTAEEPF